MALASTGNMGTSSGHTGSGRLGAGARADAHTQPPMGPGFRLLTARTQHARTGTCALTITPTCQCQCGHSHRHLAPTWNHATSTLASTQHARVRARSSSVAAAERESDSESSSSLRPPAELEHEIEIKNRAQGTILPGEVALEMIAFVYVPAITSHYFSGRRSLHSDRRVGDNFNGNTRAACGSYPG